MILPTHLGPAQPSDPTPWGIVFYDGGCGLCGRLVGFLARQDRRRHLRFAPLGGTTAAVFLPEADRVRVDTVILQRGDQRLYRSTAAIVSFSALGGVWQVMRILLLVPRPVRDLAYDWVAAHRGRWFGRDATCLLPAGVEPGTFLP